MADKALTLKEKNEKIRDLIEQYKPQIADLLPKHLSVERIFRVAMLCVGRTPKLAECTPASLLGAVLECSRRGLEPGAGPGHTWLIPFKSNGRLEVQLIVDYRAIIKSIRKNPRVSTILVEAVHKNDEFEYGSSVTGPFLTWKPARTDRGEITDYFAAAWDKDGRLLSPVVMTVEEINKAHRSKSRNKGGPWTKDPEWMYKKSVIRQLGKLLPEGDMDTLLTMDDRASAGLSQNLGSMVDVTETVTPDEDGVDEKGVVDQPKSTGPKPQPKEELPLTK